MNSAGIVPVSSGTSTRRTFSRPRRMASLEALARARECRFPARMPVALHALGGEQIERGALQLGCRGEVPVVARDPRPQGSMSVSAFFSHSARNSPVPTSSPLPAFSRMGADMSMMSPIWPPLSSAIASERFQT